MEKLQRPQRVLIENLRLRAIIGANPEERTKKQDVVISYSFVFDAFKALNKDDLKHTVNYKTITKRIIKEVEESEYMLLESLTDHVFNLIKSSSEAVTKIKVRVEKPHALRFADNVVCEMDEELF